MFCCCFLFVCFVVVLFLGSFFFFFFFLLACFLSLCFRFSLCVCVLGHVNLDIVCKNMLERVFIYIFKRKDSVSIQSDFIPQKVF